MKSDDDDDLDPADIPNKPTDELLDWLGSFTGRLERLYLYAAAVWKELAARKVDLSASMYQRGLFRFIRKIADGSYSAKAIARCTGKVRRTILTLPFAEQEKWADRGSVPLVVPKDGGKGFDLESVPLNELESTQIDQVFGEGFVRSEREQKGWLKCRLKAIQKGRRVVDKQAKIEVDLDTKKIWFGGVWRNLGDVLEVLRTAGCLDAVPA